MIVQKERARCSVSRCFRLLVSVARCNGKTVVSKEWLTAQVEWANRLLAALDAGVYLGAWSENPNVPCRLPDRSSRARLAREVAREKYQATDIPIFVTGRLDDVDIPGEEIRGVHWRSRWKGEKYHYVVLSSIAPAFVLIHELGHYFGMGHSRYIESIMNKLPRNEPPLSLRTFAKPEYNHLRRVLRTIFRRSVRTEKPANAEGQ